MEGCERSPQISQATCGGGCILCPCASTAARWANAKATQTEASTYQTICILPFPPKTQAQPKPSPSFEGWVAEMGRCLFIQLPALQERDAESPAPAGSSLSRFQGQLHPWVCPSSQGWTTESLEHGPLTRLPHIPMSSAPRKAAEAAQAISHEVCPGCLAPIMAIPAGPATL